MQWNFLEISVYASGKAKLHNNIFFFWGGDKMQNHHFSRRKSGEMLINGKIIFFKHLTVSFELKKQTQREQDIFASISTEGNICTNICPRTGYLLFEAHSFLHMFLRQIEDSLFENVYE